MDQLLGCSQPYQQCRPTLTRIESSCPGKMAEGSREVKGLTQFYPRERFLFGYPTHRIDLHIEVEEKDDRKEGFRLKLRNTYLTLRHGFSKYGP